MFHIHPRQNYQRGTKSSNTGACGGHSTSKPQWTLGSRGQQQAGGENKLTGGFPTEGGRHGQDPELPEEDGGREAGSYSWALRETDRHVSMLEKQLFLRERSQERGEGERNIGFAEAHSFNSYSLALGTRQKSELETTI